MPDEAPTIETQTPAEQQPVSLSLLASQVYPNDFKGKVKQPEPAAVAETEQEAETSGQEAQEQQTETEQEAQTETQQEAQQEVSAEEGAEVTTEGETNISSFGELVESQGWDSEWANGLTETIKVNGVERQVSRSEMISSFQTQEAATKNLDEAKEKGRAQTQQLVQKNEQINQGLSQTAALIERAEKLLESDISSAELATLRNSDPAEYAARKSDLDQRRTEINTLKNDAIAQYGASSQVINSLSDEQKQALMQEEFGKLLVAVPEWKDQAVYDTDRQKLGNYLIESGFSQEDVKISSDHRLITMARKAMLYDEGQTKTSAAMKKVAKIPKVAKPGGPKPADQTNQEKRMQAKSRLKKSGSFEDALAVLRS